MLNITDKIKPKCLRVILRMDECRLMIHGHNLGHSVSMSYPRRMTYVFRQKLTFKANQAH